MLVDEMMITPWVCQDMCLSHFLYFAADPGEALDKYQFIPEGYTDSVPIVRREAIQSSILRDRASDVPQPDLLIISQCLLKLNQNLFGQSVTVALMVDQCAEQPAPDQACETNERGVEGRQQFLLWSQEERKQHRDQSE